MKKAFTLIELLVVIAIIAILAAILFPVFAQAKQAAKGAASISNAKQLALASLMYSGDSDDNTHPGGAWNTGSDPVQFDSGDTVSTWAHLLIPYIKTGGIFEDPTASPTPKLGNLSSTIASGFVPHYGYNYVTLSPMSQDASGNLIQSTVSFTSLGDPAGTVLYASKYGYSESAALSTSGTFYSFGYGTALWTTVEMPDCTDAPGLCAANWGKSDGFINDPATIGVSSVEAGANTGGVSLHSGGSAAVAFTDGHTKKMKPGALAAGTNWTPDIQAGSLVMTDETKYLWDAK